MIECGCWRGGDCTKTTVCAVESAVEDAVGPLQRALGDALCALAIIDEDGQDLALIEDPDEDAEKWALKQAYELWKSYQ